MPGLLFSRRLPRAVMPIVAGPAAAASSEKVFTGRAVPVGLADRLDRMTGLLTNDTPCPFGDSRAVERPGP